MCNCTIPLRCPHRRALTAFCMLCSVKHSFPVCELQPFLVLKKVAADYTTKRVMLRRCGGRTSRGRSS